MAKAKTAVKKEVKVVTNNEAKVAKAAKVVAKVKMAGEVKNATLLIKRRLKKEYGLGNAVLRTDKKTGEAILKTTTELLSGLAKTKHNLNDEEVAYILNHFKSGHFAKYLKVKAAK